MFPLLSRFLPRLRPRLQQPLTARDLFARRSLYLFARSVAILVPATIFLKDNLYDVSFINGPSMAPTLSPKFHETGEKDWVVWAKFRPTGDLKRGDVIAFRLPHDPEGEGVKRVIGLPGDVVVLDPRRRPKRSRDGADIPESVGWDSWNGRVEVPKGHLWVEGDNWRRTRDSNWYGPISMSLVEGKAMSILAPWGRALTEPWEEPGGFKTRTKVLEGKARWLERERQRQRRGAREDEAMAVVGEVWSG
jgi:mitochondrial inner membrane protease subunit 2